MERNIQVLIVDDSAVVRRTLTVILEKDRTLKTSTASDPLFALKKIEKDGWPDVIVLDIEMPRMDGLTFLKKIMNERPTPVVICSSLAQEGAEPTVEALRSGAVEIISKPRIGLQNFLDDESRRILEVVRAAAGARVARRRGPEAPEKRLSADAVLARSERSVLKTTDRIVALGTSTGGTQALEKILRELPPTAPGIVIVQHMPEQFTKAFAERLDSLCDLEVREAVDGDRVHAGLALIAPGNYHMLLGRSGAQYRVQVQSGPPVNRHRPSVDVLFRSVAQAAGKNALGIIMTGMGDDGANGLLEMRQAGADTIAQDEASCVVYGMPREAVKREAAAKILPLDQLASEIMKHADA